MWRRIDRYMLREVLPPFGAALLAFLAFIALQVVIYLSDAVLSRGAGAGELFRLLGLKLPSLLTLAIPGGVLLAIFWALGRLSTARELLAFQAVGYSLGRIARPLILFGLLASVATFLLSEFAVPRAEDAYRREYLTLVLGGGEAVPQEEVFFRGPRGDLYYVRRYRGGVAEGIVVYDVAGRVAPPSGDFPAVITAASGGFSPQGELELRDGRILHFDPEGRLARVDGFSVLRIEVGADVERLILGGKTPAQMSLRELAARIAAMRRAGVDPRGLVVEFHAKIAVAASAFLFALFGAPVGMVLGRKGRVAGAAAGFLLAGAAQALFLWTKTLARQGMVPPAWGAWLPAVPFAALGVGLLWRLDGRRLPFLALAAVLLFPAVSHGAPPPFSLRAQTASVTLGERAFVAVEAEAEFQGFSLAARKLSGREAEGGWRLTAAGARLKGEDLRLEAGTLEVEFSGDEPRLLRAQDLSGELGFRGPEKEETLVFAAERAEVVLERGEIHRVEAEGVSFTTCPCLPGAPYSVRARVLVYIRDQWLVARDLYLRSFGATVWWLPLYVSRLGKEGTSLFPRVGFAGGNLFLYWSFPFSLQEEALWGAVGVTVYPGLLRVDPEASLFWDGGEVRIAAGALSISGSGEWGRLSWRGNARLSGGEIRARLSGDLPPWSWTLAWEGARREGVSYEKAPEISLRRSASLGGTTASLELSAGRYLEGDVDAYKAGVSLSVRLGGKVPPLGFTTNLGGRYDLYYRGRPSSRYRVDIAPAISLAGIRLGYAGRFGAGTSPLGFDPLPPRSRVTLSFAGKQGSVRQSLSLAWDLVDGGTSGGWSLAISRALELSVSFDPYPLRLRTLQGALRLGGEGWGVELRGGAGLFPRLEVGDLIAKGRVSGDGFSLRWGARFSSWPPLPRRAFVDLSVRFLDVYRIRIAGEYDFGAGKLIQGLATLTRTFSGCLRVGFELGTRSVKLVVEVPAFPGARVEFSPQDKALRWGS